MKKRLILVFIGFLGFSTIFGADNIAINSTNISNSARKIKNYSNVKSSNYLENIPAELLEEIFNYVFKLKLNISSLDELIQNRGSLNKEIKKIFLNKSPVFFEAFFKVFHKNLNKRFNCKFSERTIATILSDLKCGAEKLKSILSEEAQIKSFQVDKLNAFNESDFSTAAKLNNISGVKILNQYKADINFQNSQKATPLLLAALYHQYNVADWLLKNGANFDQKDTDNKDILYYLISNIFKESSRIFDPNFYDSGDVNAKYQKAKALKFLDMLMQHKDFDKIINNKSVDNKNFSDQSFTFLERLAFSGEYKFIRSLINSKRAVLDIASDTLIKVLNSYFDSKDLLNNENINNTSNSFYDLKKKWQILDGKYSKSIKALIRSNKVNVEEKDESAFENTALMKAVELELPKVARTLLKKGASVASKNSLKYTAKDFAKNTNLKNLITKTGQKENSINSELFIEAVKSENLDEVKRLISAGIYIDYQEVDKERFDCEDNVGKSALMIAAELGNADLFNILLEAGADPFLIELGGWDAFRYALYNYKLNILKIIYDKLDRKKITKNFIFEEEPEYNIMNELCIGEAETSENSEKLNIIKQFEIVCRFGININAKDIHGETPIFYAARWNSVILLNLLIKAGAEVNVKNDIEESPLLVAASNGYLKAVEILLKNKANINDQNCDGDTPLMVAQDNGDNKMETLLRKYNADLSIKNNDGKCANRCQKIKLEDTGFSDTDSYGEGDDNDMSYSDNDENSDTMCESSSEELEKLLSKTSISAQQDNKTNGHKKVKYTKKNK